MSSALRLPTTLSDLAILSNPLPHSMRSSSYHHQLVLHQDNTNNNTNHSTNNNTNTKRKLESHCELVTANEDATPLREDTAHSDHAPDNNTINNTNTDEMQSCVAGMGPVDLLAAVRTALELYAVQFIPASNAWYKKNKVYGNVNMKRSLVWDQFFFNITKREQYITCITYNHAEY